MAKITRIPKNKKLILGGFGLFAVWTAAVILPETTILRANWISIFAPLIIAIVLVGIGLTTDISKTRSRVVFVTFFTIFLSLVTCLLLWWLAIVRFGFGW